MSSYENALKNFASAKSAYDAAQKNVNQKQNNYDKILGEYNKLYHDNIEFIRQYTETINILEDNNSNALAEKNRAYEEYQDAIIEYDNLMEDESTTEEQLNEARQRISSTLNSYNSASNRYDIAVANYNSYIESLPPDIKEINTQITNKKKSLDNAGKELENAGIELEDRSIKLGLANQKLEHETAKLNKNAKTSTKKSNDTDNVLFKGSKNTIINKDNYNAIKDGADMQAVKLAYNLVNRYDSKTNWYTKFSRFGMIDAHNAMTPTREYLFFTRPDLHLTDKSKSGKFQLAEWINNTSSYLKDVVNRYPYVAQQLEISDTRSTTGLGKYPFAPLLSNALAPDSFLEMPDLSSETIDTAANVYGTKMFYRGSSMKSDEEFDFSLEFIDSKYLDIYTYFKIYDEYERCKWLGQVDNTISPWSGYAENRVLHDAFSIYKFVVADDGMTLVYWARITGVIPTSVPRSALSDMSNNAEGQKISVSFKGHFVRDMDPRIIYDFNKLNNIGRSLPSDIKSKEIPLTYTSGNKLYPTMTNGEWAGRPYIITSSSSSAGTYVPKRKYFLTWLR